MIINQLFHKKEIKSQRLNKFKAHKSKFLGKNKKVIIIRNNQIKKAKINKNPLKLSQKKRK